MWYAWQLISPPSPTPPTCPTHYLQQKCAREQYWANKFNEPFKPGRDLSVTTLRCDTHPSLNSVPSKWRRWRHMDISDDRTGSMIGLHIIVIYKEVYWNLKRTNQQHLCPKEDQSILRLKSEGYQACVNIASENHSTFKQRPATPLGEF